MKRKISVKSHLREGNKVNAHNRTIESKKASSGNSESHMLNLGKSKFANRKPKFKIGDKFKVHFSYYDENEWTTHTITRIDMSGDEEDGIVYWDDNTSVYVTEEYLLKNQNKKNTGGKRK